MLELNDVLLKGESHTLSLMARERQITCLTGGSRWLYAMLGFEPVVAGFISIDGEPLTTKTAAALRRLMAFAPQHIDDVGEIERYEAPTADDVFALRANRECNADALKEEVAQTGVTDSQQARLLAVAVLRQRPILLVEEPEPAMLPYLRKQAAAGRIVIVSSTDEDVINAADNVVMVGATEQNV
ncbi:MAG: hypothetical protein K6B13_05585 [Prevotella sp.]|nr:hypothetical protein [Prevotella sp.]